MPLEASDEPGSARAVHVEGRLQTNSSEVIGAAVTSGMGYSPTWLFEQGLDRGEVVRLVPG
jgi:DNA-binding transcriptional LysR family regulator